MFHKKKIVGGIYYINAATFRSPMLQRLIQLAPLSAKSVNFEANEDLGFMDGNLKQVAHVGLGCVLIHKTVMQKIKFRYVKGDRCHPDSFFAADCRLSGYKIYADTNCIASHDNRDWGIYGVDFK